MSKIAYPQLVLRSLSVLALSMCMAQQASAAFPFNDPFTDRTGSGGTSYAVGADLANQADGSGAIWNAITPSGAPNIRPVIVSGNLSSTNLPQSTGNSISFAPASTPLNGGKGVRLNFGYLISTTNYHSYYSFLLELTDLSTVTT